MTARKLAWAWIGRTPPGREDLVLAAGPDGIVAEGDITAALDAVPFRLRYRLACDLGWRFRAATLSLTGAAAARTCRIACAEDGTWSVDGCPRPDLADAAAIDIMATPLTNTLPIRTLTFPPGVPVRLTVAYVAVPSLAVAAQIQEYTCLAPGRFRYRGLASGFTAELAVDEEGLVLRYGTVWRRV